MSGCKELIERYGIKLPEGTKITETSCSTTFEFPEETTQEIWDELVKKIQEENAKRQTQPDETDESCG